MRRRGAGRAWMLGTALLALVACAINPVTGEREIVLMSPEREAALGAEGAGEVERQIGLVGDAALGDYVEALGQRLAVRSPRRDVTYRFHVAAMPEPNAFALPGGYIYVSRGLLALVNSEDELSNVIGHEIGHVAARHAAQRETRTLGVGLLSVLGTLAAGALGGAEAAQSVAQLGQVAGAGLIASYGRDQERQADDLGQHMAAAAGWDPAGMAQFLATLERETVLSTGAARLPSFLDSHPATAERVAATAARARELPVTPAPPIAGSRAAFLARLEGLLVGPDPAEGVFERERFQHPGLAFALDFPAGWRTSNQKHAVGAISPNQDAVVVLAVQGPTGDAAAAAQEFARANQLSLVDGARLRIGGFDAYRARAVAQGQQGPLGLDLSWVAHPAGIFRITGTSGSAGFARYEPAFRASALSFRALRPEERARIHELRLRVVTARAGETLAELSARTANRWSPEETAVANGLPDGIRLRGGEALKIAVQAPLR